MAKTKLEQRIEKIANIGKKNTEIMISDKKIKRMEREELKNSVLKLVPRIKDLIKIGKALEENDIPFGKQTKALVGYEEEFVSYHNLGFFFPSSRRDNSKLMGIGIRDTSSIPPRNLLIDENGEIIYTPSSMHHDVFCEQYRYFIDNFDGFERKFYEYVDNL